jgi:hypothetical protein
MNSTGLVDTAQGHDVNSGFATHFDDALRSQNMAPPPARAQPASSAHSADNSVIKEINLAINTRPFTLYLSRYSNYQAQKSAAIADYINHPAVRNVVGDLFNDKLSQKFTHHADQLRKFEGLFTEKVKELYEAIVTPTQINSLLEHVRSLDLQIANISGDVETVGENKVKRDNTSIEMYATKDKDSDIPLKDEELRIKTFGDEKEGTLAAVVKAYEDDKAALVTALTPIKDAAPEGAKPSLEHFISTIS